MAKAVATKGKGRAKRPRGDRRSRNTIEQFLRVVEDEWTKGVPSHAIVRLLAKKNVAQATVYRYIAEVQEKWAASVKAAEPFVREQRLARLRKLAAKLEKEGEYVPMVQLEKLLNAMLGVNAPERHDVRAAVVSTTEAAPELDLALVDDATLEGLERAADAKLSRTAPAGLIGDTTVVAT